MISFWGPDEIRACSDDIFQVELAPPRLEPQLDVACTTARARDDRATWEGGERRVQS